MANNDGTTVVTYASLDLAAASIDRQAKQLDQDLRAIKSMIASVSELWEGEAKTAYRDAQKRWDADATGIRENLSQIARAVRDAETAYRSGDKRAAANFL
ncbi:MULTISPECIES: WXG100 family type VII secretion target [unclassified Streptomyces]|uniref:WXG100 family type VII secretion target n=1 Tax=unclassified Streptomyces TaxID=2593676 RepID=UPI00344DD399